MYKRDMAELRDHGLASPEGLVDIIAFVLSTIQQPLSSCQRQCTDIRKHGARSKYLFGSKRAGYRYARQHKRVLHAALVEAHAIGDTIAALDVLTIVPGLGLVKAGFVAQCLGFEVACIDTHNLRRLSLPASAFKLSKDVKPATKLKKIQHYVGVCKDTGGSEFWWDTWCEHVAGNRANKALDTADKVSAFHVTAAIGE